MNLGQVYFWEVLSMRGGVEKLQTEAWIPETYNLMRKLGFLIVYSLHDDNTYVYEQIQIEVARGNNIHIK